MTRNATLVLIPLAALLVAPVTADARQEPPSGPAVEVGIDGALASDFYNGSARPWGPRVAFNVSEETAIVLFGESRVSKSAGLMSQWTSRLLGFEVRHVVSTSGPLTAHVVAGGGVSHRWESRDQGAFTINGRRYELPDRVRTRLLPAVVAGAGVGQRISRYATLRQELRFILAGDNSELRAQLGLTVPIGRYRTGSTYESLRLGEATIVTGQSIWLTDALGAERAGTVRRINHDRIELATSTGSAVINVDGIRRIERPDGVGDGVRRGALIGAAAAGGTFGVMDATCRGDCMGVGGALILGGGIGAGFGALFGAIVDGLHRHRTTVFDRAPRAATVQVAPLVGAARTGVSLRATW